MLNKELIQMQVLNLLAAQALTADGESAAPIDLNDYEGALALVLDAGAGGVSKTLTMKLQHADTSGGSYTDVTGGAFENVGNAASVQKITLNSNELKRFVKVVYTVTASGSFATSVKGFAVKKYRA